MDSDQTRVALLGYGYWGPNLARNLHLRLGRAWVACVDPDPARRAGSGSTQATQSLPRRMCRLRARFGPQYP